MNRQRLILAVLLGVLALAIGYSIVRFPRQEKADKPSAVTAATPSGANRKSAGGVETRVHLELLQKNQESFTGFKKNIFAPIFRDLSKLPPVKPVIPAPPPPPPPPVTPPTAINTAEQELAQFTFLGFLDREKNKTIFLAKNKEIFLVKKGERIAGKYEAAAITDDALTLRRVGGDTTEIIIPLIESQSLKVPQHQQTAPSPLPQQAGRPRIPARTIPQRSPGAPPAPTETRTTHE